MLTDDMSMDLLRFMPHVAAMQRHGLTFEDYFVSDSLCCPSRASIFTGEFPHDTGVYSNSGRHGGYRRFYNRGEERRTFAVALRRVGYGTAMMGKYLNGYGQTNARVKDGSTAPVPATYVPPGWSEWDVAGWGYPEFNYRFNENGTLRRYGHRPSDYLTDVLAQRGVDFIDRAVQSGHPFFLELATFAPHAPYVPAPRNAKDFPRLRAPRPPSFNVLPTHAPHWLAVHQRLTTSQTSTIDRVYRRRAQSVEAVDEMIAKLQAALRAHGLARNTYLVFSSDNGLHTGEYRLMPGKLTAFNTDIHVPLVIVGPGVPKGRRTTAMAENVDLAETFAAIAGTRIAGDGHSLLPMLHGHTPRGWRNAILVEHRSSPMSLNDPDYQQPASGMPTSYEAIRTHQFLYAEYADRERELYDLQNDPFELHNTIGHLTKPQRRRVHGELLALKRCHGETQCWRAMHVSTHP